MGLLKKLKKIHKKTIGGRIEGALFGSKKKKKGGAAPAAEAKPATAKTSLAARPALAKQVAASQAAAAAKKPPATPMPKPNPQTGGPGQRTPVGGLGGIGRAINPLRTGGPGQMSTMAPKPLRTGGPGQMSRPGTPKPMQVTTPGATPSSAGASLNRIAKGYNQR